MLNTSICSSEILELMIGSTPKACGEDSFGRLRGFRGLELYKRQNISLRLKKFFPYNMFKGSAKSIK